MTALELKTTLIKEIEKTEDLETLETIQTILSNLNSDTPILSEWQLKRIAESEKQIENGQFVTKEVADRKIEEWLKK